MKKSKQHIIPRVYLQSFCDPRRPSDVPSGRRYTPNLWVHPKSLTRPGKRSAPQNVAWARDAYTLRGDDPKHPWLEEALGRLESAFAPAMRRVIAGHDLSDHDRSVLALFVGALHERTLGMLQHRQAFFDDLAHIARQYEAADQGLNAASDEKAEREAFWERFKEEGKRQLANFASGFAEVVGPHAFILENATPMPLVSSDSPVTYRQVHGDELVAAGFPPEWLYRDIPRSARHFFVLCPLSPRHAFVASEFCLSSTELLRRRSHDLKLIYVLNELTRGSADAELYAPTAHPYGPLLAAALAHDQRSEARSRSVASGLSVYSTRERYWLRTTAVEHGRGDHVLTARLTFRTDDLSTLHAMAADGEFAEITIIDEGRVVGGMRQAWFVRVALDPGAESIIENGPFRPTA